MIGRRTAPPIVTPEEPKGFDDYDVSLGDVMRGERATLGKSLLDVQRELKIRATYIAAIENADPSVFETPGFIAGYVRSYARYLGMDPEWAYAAFCREGKFAVVHGMSMAASGSKASRSDVRVPAVSKDMFEAPKTPFVPHTESLFSRIEPGALGSSLVLVALIGFIGYGGWSVLQEVQRVQFTPVDQTPGIVSEVTQLASADNLSPVDGIDTLGLAAPAPDALDRLYRPQALEVPVLTARDGPIAALDPGLATALLGVQSDTPAIPGPPRATDTTSGAPLFAAASAKTADDGPNVQVVAADAPEVVMFAVRPSWVRVKAVDGTVLFEKILDAGERYVLPKTEEPPLLRAGNAGSIYFTVNGQTYGPSGSGPSVVKNVALGAEALKAKYPVADLGRDGDLAKIVAIAEALSGN